MKFAWRKIPVRIRVIFDNFIIVNLMGLLVFIVIILKTHIIVNILVQREGKVDMKIREIISSIKYSPLYGTSNVSGLKTEP